MYKYAKDFYKETGIAVGTAQYGETHSIGGVLGVSLFDGIASKFIQEFGSSENTGSATDVTGNTSSIREFTKAKKNYDNARNKGNSEVQKKWAAELKKIGDANPDNPTIKRIYNTEFQNELNGILK